MTNSQIIKENVTLVVAADWEHDSEKTLCFENWMDEFGVDVSLTDAPNQYDRLQELFEDCCEKLLRESRKSMAAGCGKCGGWTTYGGMSHRSEDWPCTCG